MTEHESAYYPDPSSTSTGSVPSPESGSVKEQVGVLGQDLRELARIAREAAREEIAHYRERGEWYLDSARERGADMQATLRSSVRESPFRSLGYALGAGVVLGFLLRR